MMKTARLLILFALSLLLLTPAVPAPQSAWETSFERQTNERQPPDKVLPAIGVKPGLVIGEVGPGRGRYTVFLARAVGESGKIYAEDINADGLDYLRRRCQGEGIRNVETILGRVDDPLFPPASLDMAFMVLTYHHLAKPVDLLQNLARSLKPGATIVIIDPDPERDADRGGHESTSLEKMRREAYRAGLQVVRIETFLERDNIFILQARGAGERADPSAALTAKPALLPFPAGSKERAAVIDEYLRNVENLADRFVPFVHRNASDEAMPYRLFTPGGLVPGRKYPLVVFLHGAGGSGTDNLKQLQGANVFGGLVWALPENQRRHPCFIVAPQTNVNWPCVIIEEGQRPRLCPGQRLGDGARLALEIVDKLLAELPIDRSRIYVTGQSMGGAGVWHMIARRPGFFAAAVPVCGLPDFADVQAMTKIPIWNFNGERDPIEPAERQRRWMAEIVKAGGEPIYTEYAGVEHDSFRWAYTEPALVEWLFGMRH